MTHANSGISDISRNVGHGRFTVAKVTFSQVI